MVIQRTAILMFKNSLNMVPKSIGLLFTKNCIFTIMKLGRIDPFIGKGEAIYKTFSFRAIQLWNHKSINIKIGTTFAQFKKKSLEYLKCHEISYRIAK